MRYLSLWFLRVNWGCDEGRFPIPQLSKFERFHHIPNSCNVLIELLWNMNSWGNYFFTIISIPSAQNAGERTGISFSNSTHNTMYTWWLCSESFRVWFITFFENDQDEFCLLYAIALLYCYVLDLQQCITDHVIQWTAILAFVLEEY